jgi:hypothetical protein
MFPLASSARFVYAKSVRISDSARTRDARRRLDAWDPDGDAESLDV